MANNTQPTQVGKPSKIVDETPDQQLVRMFRQLSTQDQIRMMVILETYLGRQVVDNQPSDGTTGS